MVWSSVSLISDLFTTQIGGSLAIMGLIVLAFLSWMAIKGNMGVEEIVIVVIAPLIVLSAKFGVLQPAWLAGIVYLGFAMLILFAVWRVSQK